jgi:hypothetical protein
LPPVTLRAPGAALTIADHALRHLRIHQHQVLDAITVAVRDEAWGTFPADIRVTSTSPDGRTAELRGEHGDVFAWTGRVEVTAGSLHFEMRGRVLRDVDSRRIGICLLHPQALAGRDFNTDMGAGAFGVAVDPRPTASGFHSLRFDVGCPIEIVLDGPPFEMEDHRNWSDPGWKSYCPPLGAAGPLRRRAGEEIVQAVTVRGRPSTVPAIGGYVRGRLVGPGRSVADEFTGGAYRHVDLVEGVPPADLSGSAPLSVALVGTTNGWLTDTAARLARHRNVERISVFDPNTHTTAPGSAELVRATLRDLGSTTAVGGGSRAHLAELNRLDAIGDWDFCTLPLTAQAHHSDDGAILATTRAMPAMLATVRRIAPDLPIVVGPLAFRRRVGANSPAAPDDPVDPREIGPVGATWLLGAVLGLRGADALTVLLAPGGPAGAMLNRLAMLRGRPFVDLPTGHPDVLAATVLGKGKGKGKGKGEREREAEGETAPITLVANLGTEPARIFGTTVAARDHTILDPAALDRTALDQGEPVCPD